MRYGLGFVVGSVVICVASLCFPQDEVEGPWGIAQGDIFGRARTDAIPELFSEAASVLEAWVVDPFSLGSAPPGGRSSMVFDASGNLYWISQNSRLTSVTPDSGFRWNASSQGVDYNLGDGLNTTSPVVGGERVYVLAGPGPTPRVAAFQKGNGELEWETSLPDGPWGSDSQLSPVLLAGKLYVVGESDGASTNVYQVDADTGNLDWQSPVAITLNFRGTMALAPGAFPGGDHGLYFNGASGSGTDGIGEVYGLRIDPDPATGGATLEWESDGGFVGRSHVIYNPAAPGGARLYTHTWADYGATLYSFDPQTGASIGNSNSANSGHGFYDVGCVDFDDQSLVVGGFDGNVVVYTDDGTGQTTDVVYPFHNGEGPGNWFGEYRTLGQLLLGASGESILVSGTNSRVGDLGPEFTARVVMVDVTNAQVSEDGPLYMDDIEVFQGPDLGSLVAVFSEDFEGLVPGPLPGQDDWEDDRVSPGGDGGPVEVVDDPLAAGQGQVAELDAFGNSGGWQGIFHDFPDTTEDVVVIQYLQYREDLTDNAWVYFGNAINDFNSAWTLGWDQTLGYFPFQFSGATVPQSTGGWESVTFTYEGLTNPTPGSVTVEIGGVTSSTTQDTVQNIQGFGIQLEATGVVTGGSLNAPVLEIDTGVQVDNGFTVRGGPLVGPDGKLYYFDGDGGVLHAIEALTSAAPEFRRGDADADGSFNGLVDGLFILNFQFVIGSPAPSCLDAADADDSGSFNGLVDGLYVLNFQFVPGSPAPPAPGPIDCGADPTMDATDCEIYDFCP